MSAYPPLFRRSFSNYFGFVAFSFSIEAALNIFFPHFPRKAIGTG
jgi:hypothetical protein